MVEEVERKYFVPSKAYEYLFTHPQPGTLVVEAANQKERQGQQGSTPKSKEAISLVGRFILRGGSRFTLPTSRYSFNSWNMLSKFQELLLRDSHSEFAAVLEEGKVIVRTSLQASLDSVDSAACMMATAVAMRRSSGLQVLGLPHKVQQTIQELPLDCLGLFSEQTDTRLHSLKHSWATLKSLGLNTPGLQRKQFKLQPPLASASPIQDYNRK
ncbi:hypothetical protein UY3_04056 [Chelonia mydas]|uniref:Uncharacterized protein n=1 Tax=Chelonia mydas TaxID=8469 RepID=M7CD93_CHEMY|nr:hypothetical protein UY3_04056 [Chelonia mydas]